jgi:hypothetical protein
MARQGLMPAFLGRLHAKRQTPHGDPNLMVVVLALALWVTSRLAEHEPALLGSFTVVNASLASGPARQPFEVPVRGCLCQWRLCESMVEGREATQLLHSEGSVAAIVALYLVLRPKVTVYRG